MLTDMRQQAVARITKEEREQRASEVVILLLTRGSKGKLASLDQEEDLLQHALQQQLKKAWQLCSFKNSTDIGDKVRFHSQELDKLCDPSKVNDNFTEIIKVSISKN
jgi:hypothetical protein